MTRKKFVGVTQGLRGWFAIIYDADGPIQSGIGSYKTAKLARSEAIDISMAEDIPLDSSFSDEEKALTIKPNDRT